MGDGLQYIDIILLAMVAGFIALRLRGVLGKRTGDEEQRAEKRRRAPADGRQTRYAEEDERSASFRTEPSGAEEAPSWTIGIDVDSPLGKTLSRIKVADRNFDPESFINGARAAYALIVEAFANGERDVLKPLLSPEIYDDFEKAITEREKQGHHMETKVVDIDDVKIEDASLENKFAEITVRFTTHCMSVTRDEEGRIIAGNPSDADQIVDLWTFGRTVTSRDPNWLLIATSREE